MDSTNRLKAAPLRGNWCCCPLYSSHSSRTARQTADDIHCHMPTDDSPHSTMLSSRLKKLSVQCFVLLLH